MILVLFADILKVLILFSKRKRLFLNGLKDWDRTLIVKKGICNANNNL